MGCSMSLKFPLTSLVVVLLPGTGVIFTLAIGLGRGFCASIADAVGFLGARLALSD